MLWSHTTSCLCYLPQPSASADNIDLSFDNSWYNAQPHPIIVYYCNFVGHCGAFCGLKWRIWRAKMYFSPLNKPIKSENQTVVRYKPANQIEKPLECSRRFLAALVKEMMASFSCPNHGWKHSKQRRKSKFSVFSTRGRRSTKVRGGIRASKHQKLKTAYSSFMAGGEVNVSFAASSQTMYY